MYLLMKGQLVRTNHYFADICVYMVCDVHNVYCNKITVMNIVSNLSPKQGTERGGGICS
jgi:hypothetical protein